MPEIFGQIEQRRLDLPVHRMDMSIGRMAQADDADIEPVRFERADLLGDEGFRKARIALEHEGDGSHGAGSWRRLRRAG